MRYLIIFLTALACWLPASAQTTTLRRAEFVNIGAIEINSRDITWLYFEHAGELSGNFTWDKSTAEYRKSNRKIEELHTKDDQLVIKWTYFSGASDMRARLVTTVVPLDEIKYASLQVFSGSERGLVISLGMDE